MKSTHHFSRTTLWVGLLGAALTVGASVSAATDAEAKKPRIERSHKASRGDKAVRNRAPSREGKIVREHKAERHREPVRDYRAESHRKPVLVRDHHRARRVVRHHYPSYPRVVHRPWYREARRIHIHRSPFFFHAGFGIYFGGLYVNVGLGDVAPRGYVYRDPYCGQDFYTVDDYHRHLLYHDHYPALEVVAVTCY